jgi:excisionase family DNA binding protein
VNTPAQPLTQFPAAELLRCPQVAAWLGVTERTLRAWRHSGKGPQFVKIGGSPRYRRRDVEGWLAASLKSRE